VTRGNGESENWGEAWRGPKRRPGEEDRAGKKEVPKVWKRTVRTGDGGGGKDSAMTHGVWPRQKRTPTRRENWEAGATATKKRGKQTFPAGKWLGPSRTIENQRGRKKGRGGPRRQENLVPKGKGKAGFEDTQKKQQAVRRPGGNNVLDVAKGGERGGGPLPFRDELPWGNDRGPEKETEYFLFGNQMTPWSEPDQPARKRKRIKSPQNLAPKGRTKKARVLHAGRREQGKGRTKIFSQKLRGPKEAARVRSLPFREKSGGAGETLRCKMESRHTWIIGGGKKLNSVLLTTHRAKKVNGEKERIRGGPSTRE